MSSDLKLESLRVRSRQGDYEVTFTASVEAACSLAAAQQPAAVVLDSEVGRLWRKQLGVLKDIPTFEATADESLKTLAGVERLAAFLQSIGAHRRSRVMAIGGGIIQDLVAFTTHVYYRGIEWVFLPTTLLAQCDSCIGAKCGINVGAWKNQLGVFHAPGAIFIAPEFLNTLKDKDVASGYGEILKLALTGAPVNIDTLEQTLDHQGLRNEALPALIHNSLTIKQTIIEADEYEGGLRQILNYGHTFGHALEAATHHAIPHGTAVAWGIDVINQLGVRRGWLASSHAERVAGIVRRHLRGEARHNVSAEDLLAGARRDKKTMGSSITLAVMREPGRMDRLAVPIDHALEQDLAWYLLERDAFNRH